MFKKLTLIAATMAMTASALVPATAEARGNRGDWNRGGYDQRYDGGYGYNGGGYDNGYDRGGYDNGYRSYNGYEKSYRYRARNKCRDGGGGAIIGAIAGALFGGAVAGRGDKMTGALIGAGAGALAGNAIDRSDRPGYCR